VSARDSTADPAIRRFWDRYINKLEKQGVKAKVLRWYVIHAEEYLKAFPDKKLATHGPGEVQAYLEGIGRKQSLEEWQHHQIVDAIQNLFELIEADWLKQVDWGYWKDSSSSLPPNHPTIARDVTVRKCDHISSQSIEPSSASVRSQHSGVTTRLIN
jgi:hypothetical protein